MFFNALFPYINIVVKIVNTNLAVFRTVENDIPLTRLRLRHLTILIINPFNLFAISKTICLIFIHFYDSHQISNRSNIPLFYFYYISSLLFFHYICIFIQCQCKSMLFTVFYEITQIMPGCCLLTISPYENKKRGNKSPSLSNLPIFY